MFFSQREMSSVVRRRQRHLKRSQMCPDVWQGVNRHFTLVCPIFKAKKKHSFSTFSIWKQKKTLVKHAREGMVYRQSIAVLHDELCGVHSLVSGPRLWFPGKAPRFFLFPPAWSLSINKKLYVEQYATAKTGNFRTSDDGWWGRSSGSIHACPPHFSP